MPEKDSGLTDADRKAIAEIRRELDAGFGPLEDAVPLDVREEMDAPLLPLEDPAAHAWSSRPGVITAFVAGLLLGVIAGSVGTLAWLITTESIAPRGAASPAAPSGGAASPATPAGDPARTSPRNALGE